MYPFGQMNGAVQRSDGYAEISISDDEMHVLATLIPPRGEGSPITVEYMEAILESHGVTEGIRWEELRERVLEANGERRVLHGIVIAEGEPPIDEVPAHLRIRDELLNRLGLNAPEPPSVAPIVVVHRKDLLGRVVAKRKGRPGVTVTGEPVEPSKREVAHISPGKNTRIADGELIATRSGRLRFDTETIRVEEELEITGSVDYSTGNIEFPGDVTLKGEIKDGFHVWAAGSVNGAGTIDVSQVYCKKTFVTPGGIIGRRQQILRAGGQVSARFVEHCQIESKASIFIREYAYQSQLLALDRIVFGDEGKLIGGRAFSAHGVVAGELGNEVGVSTEVHVGINFVGSRRLESARDAYLKVKDELHRLEHLRESGETPALVSKMVHLTDLRQKYATRMENLLEQVDRNEEAEIFVKNTVFPGVVIRICRAEFYVVEALSSVRFYLEREQGRIAHEPLGEDTDSQ